MNQGTIISHVFVVIVFRWRWPRWQENQVKSLLSNSFPQVCFEHSIYGGIRCDFTNFSNQVSADLHNFRFRLNLKNCQTIAGISQIFRLTALNKNEKWPTLTTRVEAVAWKLSFQFPSGVTNMETVDMAGNGNYVNLLIPNLKNSWNHFTWSYFWRAK